jgi:hypothetical protein
VKEQTRMETITIEGGHLVERIKQFVHEGNVRRIIIRQDERIVAEFPLTFGVIGAVLAPVLAAIGAIAALLNNCTIELERVEEAPVPPAEPAVTEAALPTVELTAP